MSLEKTPEEKLYEDLYDTINRLRLAQIREAIDTIRFLVADLGEWTEVEIDKKASETEYLKKINEYRDERLRLEKALQPEINLN